jgi:hypothetical protein
MDHFKYGNQTRILYRPYDTILVTNLNNPQEPIHDWSMKQIIREIDSERNNINRSFWHISTDIKIVPTYNGVDQLCSCS